MLMSSRTWFTIAATVFVAGCGVGAEGNNGGFGAAETANPSHQKDLDTFDGVVADIVDKLDEDSKALLRDKKREDLLDYYLTWGRGIRNQYKLWSNEGLRRSCAKQRGKEGDMDPEDASVVIMEGVWSRLNAKR
jgi:hypothetical protein